MLAFDPAAVPLEQIPALITALAARLVAASAQVARPVPDADQTLSPDEAAQMLKRSRRWLARNARRLPFVKFISDRRFVCSRNGLLAWLSDGLDRWKVRGVR